MQPNKPSNKKTTLKISFFILFLLTATKLLLANSSWADQQNSRSGQISTGENAIRLIHLGDQQDSYVISKSFHFLVEADDETLDIDQVLDLPTSRWQILHGNPNFGGIEGNHWFTVNLRSSEPFEGFIEIDRPMLDIVDVYLIDQNQGITRFQVGDTEPISKHPIPHHNILVPLKLSENTDVQVLLHVNSHGIPLQFQSTLWSEDTFRLHDQSQLLLHGLYIGAILIISIYNLFIFFSVREPAYAFYVLHTIFQGSISIIILGYPLQYLWPEFSNLNSLSLFLIAPTTRLCALFFTLYFLQLTKTFPLASKVTLILIASNIINLLAIPLNLGALLTKLFYLNTILTYPLILLISIFLWWRGMKEARFYSIAWLSLVLAHIYYTQSLMGPVPYESHNLSVFMMGHILEVILLALALADRLNIAREKATELHKLSEEAAADTQALLATRVELMQSEVERLKHEQTAEHEHAANKAKSEFLSNMSHEIRTPMNAILGFSQLMQLDDDIPASHRENLGIINRSGEYLLSLINDILEMSKIEAGHVTLNPHHFDAHALLETTELMLRESCEDKHLLLSLVHSEDFPQYLYADEGKLKQILINLLGNAIKFTDQGGIVLRASCMVLQENGQHDNQPQGNEQHKNLHHSELLLISIEVEDSGTGIADADYDKVFGSFQQTDSGIKSSEGSGLGLAISREYARLMDGDITFTSQLNQGSIFRLEIRCTKGEPVDIDDQQASPRPIGICESVQGSYRILIVDDKENNLRLLREILLPIGFSVQEAVNGADAIEAFENWQPHLILMDERMPVMSGSEAIEKINATPTGKDTPIICVSASAFEEDRRRILEQGADEFIRKPLKDTEVLEKIGELLDLRYVYEASDASNHLT